MTALSSIHAIQKTETTSFIKAHVASASTAAVMSEIYVPEINLAIFHRELRADVIAYCQQLVETRPAFNFRRAVPVDDLLNTLRSALPLLPHQDIFIEDVGLLIDMYACLFDLKEVGVRMQVLDRAMCPRFHVDKLGCRLVTTYQGAGTQWLHNAHVDRSKLGAGSQGLSDRESGLLCDHVVIEQANIGDVLLLKGDGWFGNEGQGAIHRSPEATQDQKRFVVTMDFA